MKSRHLQFLCLCSFVLAPSGVHAGTILLRDTMGDPSRVDVAESVAGDVAFGVRIEVGTDDIFDGLTFFLRAVSPNANSVFAITGRIITGLPMSSGALDDPITDNADLFMNPGNVLSPINARDIGLTGPIGATLNVNGTIMLLTLSYPALAGGDYLVNVAPGATFNDNNFADHDLTIGANYTIHVIPEPASLALMFVWVATVKRLRRRRTHE